MARRSVLIAVLAAVLLITPPAILAQNTQDSEDGAVDGTVDPAPGETEDEVDPADPVVPADTETTEGEADSAQTDESAEQNADINEDGELGAQNERETEASETTEAEEQGQDDRDDEQVEGDEDDESEASEEAEADRVPLGEGVMPDEPTGAHQDAAVGLGRPLPRPVGLVDEDLIRLQRLERALGVYEAEVTEFRDDLTRIVQQEVELRRAQLQSIYDTRIDNLRGEERDHRLDAISRLEEFIRRYPTHPPETPDALFRLAELYFEKESDDYVLLDIEYSAQLDLYERGRVPDEPEEPDKDYNQTIATFGRLIYDFPDYRQVDGAYYLMGYSMLQMDREEEAVDAFVALVNRHPDSDFAQEAWVRIGEFYFEMNEYEEAAVAYNRALEHGEGRLYDEALFKLGWSYYLSNDYDSSLISFRRLIAYYDENVGETSGALREEALQYMAVTLSEEDWDLDGIRDPSAGMIRIRQTLTTGDDWERDVASRLGDVWFENERYDLAIEMFHFIIDAWPDDRLNPQRHERIVASLSRQGLFEQAFEEEGRIAALYGDGSGWYESQRGQGNNAAMAYADELTRTTILDAARYYNQQADQLRDRAQAMGDAAADAQALAQYEAAAQGYADFLGRYPTDREVNEVRFLYAQSLYYSLHLIEAAEQYALVRDSQGAERQELAGFQVVKSLELELYAQIDDGYLDPRALPTYRGERVSESEPDVEPDEERTDIHEPVTPETLPALTEQLIEAYDGYVNLGLNSEDDPTTQGRFAYLAAQTYYDWNHYDEARTRFASILDNPEFRCQEEALFSASFIIESYRIEGNFAQMEEWGTRVQQLDFCEGQIDLALIEELMEEANTMRVGAIFQSAEELFQGEQYAEAVEEYVRLVNQNPESQFAAAALNNAAVASERTQRYEGAMRLYQRVVDEYPDCEFVNDALYRVAYNSRRFFDFDRATNTYLILADRAEDEDRVRQSLFSAAELQEWTGRNQGSARTFEAFADRFPDDENAPLTLYRAGLNYESNRQYEQMIDAWHRLRREYGDRASTADVNVDAMIIDSMRREAEYYQDVVGQDREARGIYEDLLDEFDERRLTDVDSLYAAGKASFVLAERGFERWNSQNIEGTVRQQRTQVTTLINEIPDLVEGYNRITEIGSGEWTMAAYFMVGRVYQAFADKLYAVPIPAFEDPDLEDAYQMELEDFASRFEDEAVANWRIAFEVSRNLGIVNEWTVATIRELNQYLGSEFPLYKEELDFIEQEYVSPPPLLGFGAGVTGQLGSDGLDELDHLDDLDNRDNPDDGLEEFDDDSRPSPTPIEGLEEI